MPIPDQFDTTAEILAFLHDLYVGKRISSDPDEDIVMWDCVKVMGIYRPERDKNMNEWSDAAYRGDWDAIFRIAVDASSDYGLGRYINSPRLQPPPDAEGKRTLGKPPSGYTVLHQAAWHGAPVEIVQGLIELGASCGIRTTDGKYQRPLDIARDKGHGHLYSVLTPRRLPQVSDAVLAQVEAHFHKVILEEARGIFNKETMRLPDLGILRDHPRVSMQVPGMYGGFNFWWEDGHLVSESYCRIAGGSGRTNHITPEGAKLVAEGWG